LRGEYLAGEYLAGENLPSNDWPTTIGPLRLAGYDFGYDHLTGIAVSSVSYPAHATDAEEKQEHNFDRFRT